MVTTCSQTEPVDAGRGEPIIRQLKFTRIVWHQITHGILESHRQRHLVEGSRCVFLSEPHRNEIELLVTEAVDSILPARGPGRLPAGSSAILRRRARCDGCLTTIREATKRLVNSESACFPRNRRCKASSMINPVV